MLLDEGARTNTDPAWSTQRTMDPSTTTDIIGITEILPKNREEDPDNCKLKMQGYEHYSNTGANSRRGVILFIREDLNATAINWRRKLSLSN
ncbi:hypothetical protein LSH36_945g00004 [Paralvinella palmiformis]|uniref:Uncharacterized protein n=1 Tax=Paralvinella palmiformis TaxID=53620 RepID=A0AAD9MSS7_9ANNE|nr:hypothetical protein LSH36_945g00004 [Paralvinella palmiformis]